MKNGSKLLNVQPVLFHAPVEKDLVYTPDWLAELIVSHFKPSGNCLDPCRGGGAFWKLMPGAEWCEIAEGRDFLLWDRQVDWIVGNPPYYTLLGWIRHSFKVAANIVYLIPLHRVFASHGFIKDLRRWGGIREIYIVGTGTTAGFPFGHCLGAVHYQRNYAGPTHWSFAGSRQPDSARENT